MAGNGTRDPETAHFYGVVAAFSTHSRGTPRAAQEYMLLSEIHHSLRALLRVPGLTAISILTVALGVGAGTSLFSVLKAVLLNPLPYSEPDRLAWIAEINDAGQPHQVAFQNFIDWQDQNRSFSALAAYGEDAAVVSGSDIPQSSYGAMVTEDFFTVLRANPEIGRAFSRQEQQIGGAPAVILSHGLWQRAFGGRRDILGRSIRVFGTTPVVVGIMPPGFSYPERAELWVPATVFGDPGFNIRTGHNYRVIGRLKPGVPIERARADISAIERRIKQQYPSPFQSKDAAVTLLQSHLVGEVRTPLLMLFGAVGFLLLIVCVNIANLLLVRVAAQARELAVRNALGASRLQLIRRMLVESLLLSIAGGAFGLLLAAWSLSLIQALLPANMPRAGEITIDTGVVAFALAVSLATGLLFGFLPALRASAVNINEALKTASRSATAGKRSQRTQGALVVSETCLALVLVAGAGLLARSFWNVQSVNPGFHPDHVLVADAQFEGGGKQSLVPQYRDLLARVGAIPGVEAAAVVRSLPIQDGPDGHFAIERHRAETGNADAVFNVITPGYLSTMRIPLLRGRNFTAQDTENSQPVALISSEMARIYFPDRDPIGERIWFDSFQPTEHWLTVVGVVADVRQGGLTQPIDAQAYACYSQQPNGVLLNSGTLVVRTASIPPSSVAAVVRTAIRAVNPNAAPTARTMDSVLAASISKQRFQMQILGAFAVLALLLAVIGLYGVLSHMVTANRIEIGIRLALGSPRSRIFRRFAGRALTLAAFGAITGILGCLALQRVLSTLLFGIRPNDPITLFSAVAVLLLVALAGAWIPAHRAARIDPISTLRDE